MSDYLLVTNSSAGSAAEDSIDAARRELGSAGDVRVAATSSPDELDAVLASAQGRTVVVAGGDGSLHAVVNALHRTGTDLTIGLVPLGTGNDFARGADIPLDPTEAARVITSTAPTGLDLIVDETGEVTVNNVHLGVGADASRAGAVLKPRLGKVGYVVGAAVAGLRPRYLHLEVTVDGRSVYAGRVTQVAIGNNAFVGGGTELVPGADPTDGRATVIVSRQLGPGTRLAYLVHLRRGEHHRMREVSRVRGMEVSVAGEEFWTSSDGELSGPHASRTWTVLPAALQMHLPSQP